MGSDYYREYFRTVKRPEERAKRKARDAVHRHIDAGKLSRGSCEVCGVSRAEAHHDDYSKPLEIRWLCREHHMEHHKLKPKVRTAHGGQ